MKKEHIFLIFILFLTFLSFYLLYQILVPFLSSILWAVLLAIIFFPLYQRLQKLLKKKALLSALTMTLLVVLLIILPFSFLTASLANEVIDFYHWVEEMVKTGRLQAYVEEVRSLPIINSILTRVNRSLDLSITGSEGVLLKNLQQVSTFLFNQTTKILKGLSTFVIGFFFTLLSLYYLFKDGEHLLKRMKELAPLPSKQRDLLILRFTQMVQATIYGGILVAIIQGVLGGVAFWVLGLSSSVFWGTAMAFLSFIPVGGTALIWGPAAIILIIQGTYVKGIILLGFGIFGISMVDNFLKPLFISSKTNIHPLLLFFAVLGGIQSFGLVGLVVGPLIATFCLTLIEIYVEGVK
jgi:predicted PurR-regulated permease PerM